MEKVAFRKQLVYGEVIRKDSVIDLDGTTVKVTKVSEVALSHLGKTFITGWCIPKEEA